MDYLDFYDLCVKLNETQRGKFTEREIADNAYAYKVSYDISVQQGKPTYDMQVLCELLVKDMDYQDYADCPSELDIDTMEKILTEV